MKLLILGPVASGKSKWVEKLHINNPKYQVLQIDSFRKEYGDGSWKSENLAKLKFISAIDLKQKNQIIECTGVGRTGEMLKTIIPQINDPIKVILLLPPEDLRKQRLQNRADKRNLLPGKASDQDYDFSSLKRKLPLLNPRLRVIVLFIA